MKKLDVPAILLAILAFAAPIIGGQFASDQAALPPGALPYALFGGGEVPTLTAALLSLLAVVALCTLLLRRRVVQVPHQAIGGLLLVFLAVLAGAVGTSAFKTVSFSVWVQWLSYAIAFFAVVASLGRSKGPLVLIAAMFAGCVVTALFALNEYSIHRPGDPTWRVFALWVNPNATAAMLLVGVYLGLGLVFVRDRIESLVAGLGTALIVFAIMLTGSKGVLSLALPISLVVFASLVVRSRHAFAAPLAALACVGVSGVTAVCFLKGSGWVALIFSVLVSLIIVGLGASEEKRKYLAGRLAAVAGVVVVFYALLTFTAPHAASSASGGPAAPFARVASAEQTQEQSASFRLLLWKSAATLIRKNPMGYGLGTYGAESSRPGLTTQTKLAHNTYLQLGAEASLLAPILLISFMGLWLFMVLRGARSQPDSVMALRAAATTAVIAVGIHNLVDSDLYYFGIGVCVFMLLGVSLLLAGDAVAPELLPKPMRMAGTILATITGIFAIYAGSVEEIKARVRGDLSINDIQGATAGTQMLNGIAPNDGESWYLTARLSQSLADQLEATKKAAANTPTTKNLRALANSEEQSGMAASAYSTLQQALAIDPNNFLTLTQLMKLEAQEGDQNQAELFANRLVATEETEYFKIRSLPQIVPTETYAARLFLAARTQDPKQRTELLQGAINGYLSYLKTTVPVLKQSLAGVPNGDFGGETLKKAWDNLEAGRTAAVDLAKTYRAMGLPDKAAEADGFVKEFADGALGLSESK